MSDLLYTVENQVATMAINRPDKRNALSNEAIEQFLQRLDEAEADAEVRVVLVTGRGEKAFCAGADLSVFFGDSANFGEYATLIKRLATFPKPTVARVNGYCLAGGMGLMLACDMVIAREDSQFGTPEVNVGVFPMMIGALIFRNLHRKHAFEMTMLGERVNTTQALAWGMINCAVPTAEFDNKVNEVTAKLASKSPIGLRLGKEAFHTMLAMPYEEAVDFLSEQLTAVTSTEDAMEGIQAFMQKRAPQFKGR